MQGQCLVWKMICQEGWNCDGVVVVNGLFLQVGCDQCLVKEGIDQQVNVDLC